MECRTCCFQRPGEIKLSTNSSEWIRLSAYRIRGDVNILFFAVGDQIVLSKERMTFNLVGSRDYTRRFDDSLKLAKKKNYS